MSNLCNLCLSNVMKAGRVVERRRMFTSAVMPEHIIDSLPRQITKAAKLEPKFRLSMPPQLMPPQEPINVSSLLMERFLSSGSSEGKRSVIAVGCIAAGAAVAKFEMDRSTRDGLSLSRYGDRVAQPSIGLFGLR